MKQVEGLELEILELQNNLTLKTYNLGKSCQKLVDGAVSIVEKFWNHGQIILWINVPRGINVADDEHCKNKEEILPFRCFS